MGRAVAADLYGIQLNRALHSSGIDRAGIDSSRELLLGTDGSVYRERAFSNSRGQRQPGTSAAIQPTPDRSRSCPISLMDICIARAYYKRSRVSV